MTPGGSLLILLALLAAGCGDDTHTAGPPPGGAGTRVALAAPEAVLLDGEGNLYVSEFDGARVVEIAPNGKLTVVAGTGFGRDGYSGDGGPATSAQLSKPGGLAFDPDGHVVIADHGNDAIRTVDDDGVITTLAGSRAAHLDDPIGIAFGDDGALWIVDEQNGRVVRLTISGRVSTVAGSLGHPSHLVIGGAGTAVFSDFTANRVYRLDAEGLLTPLAGTGTAGFGGDGGPARRARLRFPTGLALARDGTLYVTDTDNQRVRRIDPDGVITTFAGSGVKGFAGDGGPATAAELNAPAGLALDDAGNLYIADQGNDRVRRVDTNGVIDTVAGNGR